MGRVQGDPVLDEAQSQSPPEPIWALAEAGIVIPGSRLPASCRQLPRPPVCTSCPAQPARVAEGLEPMESVCPSLLCLLVLPSLHSVLSFFWFIRPWGKLGPARLPAEHPWEAASSCLSLWGWRLSLTPRTPARQSGPLPAWGRPPRRYLGYTEAPSSL